MDSKDFVTYKKNNNIYSMNMKFDNFFKKNNLPFMAGGGKNNCGLPFGLTLLKNKNIEKFDIKYQTGGVIENNLYDKLLNMSGKKESSNKKTKKHRNKRNNKTRKH
jgi:hypothetical protein